MRSFVLGTFLSCLFTALVFAQEPASNAPSSAPTELPLDPGATAVVDQPPAAAETKPATEKKPFWGTRVVVKWVAAGKEPEVAAFNEDLQVGEKLHAVCLAGYKPKEGSFIFFTPRRHLDGAWVSWVVVDTVQKEVLYYIKGLNKANLSEVAIYKGDKGDGPACKEGVCGDVYFTTLLTVPCTYQAPPWPPAKK